MGSRMKLRDSFHSDYWVVVLYTLQVMQFFIKTNKDSMFKPKNETRIV